MSRDISSIFDLTGRVAIVTGGGSGLGREFCETLAEFGADVICPDFYKDRAEETCEMIKQYGCRTLALEVDVSKYDEVQAMFKQERIHSADLMYLSIMLASLVVVLQLIK